MRVLPRLLATAILMLAAGCDTPLEAVQLTIGHRLHPGFKETQRVRPGEKFQIGDSELYGRVVDFIPDFAYDDKAKKVVSRSKELRNPAIKIEVWDEAKGKKVEDTWALTAAMPHFSAASQLSFHVDSLLWKPGMDPAAAAVADTSEGRNTP